MYSQAFSILRILVVMLAILALATPASANEQENVLTVGPGQEYETIQAAVHAAKQGSRILVYPATYHESVVILKNNLQLLAQGEGVIVQPPHQPAGFSVFADHVTIQGFRIDFGGNEDCTPAIALNGSHNIIADNIIHEVSGCPGINAFTITDPDGGSDYNIIERNVVQGGDTGIAVRGGSPQNTNAVNRGNIIRDNTVIDIFMSPITIANGVGFTISGNRVIGALDGACIGVGAVDANQVPQGHHTIVGNILYDCALGGVYLTADTGTELSYNRIADNHIQNCYGDCISLKAFQGSTMTNNEVVANDVQNSYYSSGILLYAEEGADASNNLIQGNLAYNNHASGIYITSYVDKNRILNNEVHHNDVGIWIAGDDNLIVGNLAHDNNLDLADSGVDNLWKNNTYGTKNW